MSGDTPETVEPLPDGFAMDDPAVAVWLDALGPLMRTPAVVGLQSAAAPLVFRVDDPPAFVSGVVERATGRRLGLQATWIRFVDQATDRGVLFVVHAPHPLDGADLIVLAEPGMLRRSVIRDACRWAFLGLGLTRVVCRVPVERRDLQDYLRRANFGFEGVARDLYGIGLDGQTWAMPATRCRWLAPRPSTAPDPPPPSNPRLH